MVPADQKVSKIDVSTGLHNPDDIKSQLRLLSTPEYVGSPHSAERNVVQPISLKESQIVIIGNSSSGISESRLLEEKQPIAKTVFQKRPTLPTSSPDLVLQAKAIATKQLSPADSNSQSRANLHPGRQHPTGSVIDMSPGALVVNEDMVATQELNNNFELHRSKERFAELNKSNEIKEEDD